MTDRELLEMAAKAAGIELKWSSDPDIPPRAIPSWELWSPLTDDGDALRLAVKLSMMGGLGVAIYCPDTDDPTAVVADHDSANCCEEVKSNDPYAATRRAIVRAAAEIGKEMP